MYSNYRRYSKGDPLTKSIPIGGDRANREISRILKAILGIHRINFFVKLQCNLTHVSEGGGALLGWLMPDATFRKF